MSLVRHIAPSAKTAVLGAALALAACGPCAAIADEATAEIPAQTQEETQQSLPQISTELRIQTFCLNWAVADPNLADLVPLPSCSIAIDVENHAEGALALYDAIDALRAQAGAAPVTRDVELERCAYQRAAETSVAHSCARPDGSLFLSVGPRAVAEVVARDDLETSDAQTVLDAIVSDDTYAAAREWITNATNIGCALVSDEAGYAYWAIEISFDGAPSPEGDSIESGEATYWSGAARANLVDVTIPQSIELKSCEQYVPTVTAAVSGTAYFGYGSYPLEYSGATVQVHPGSFVWNSSNAGIVSVSSDGTMTALSPGTVTISETDADGGNPRFTVAAVDGGQRFDPYDLGECTFVGITGEDGRGNFYLNADGSVNMPAFSLVTPDNTVIDPVNYRASIMINEDGTSATITVRAVATSTVCKGRTTRTVPVIVPEPPAEEQAEAEVPAEEATGEEQAVSSEGADVASEDPEDPGDPLQETVVSERQDISLAVVTMPNLAYTGEPLTPRPVSVTLVEDDGTTTVLTEGTDYLVEGYSNNVEVGEASAVVRGIGVYGGALRVVWQIVPQGTADPGITQSIPDTADHGEMSYKVAAALAGLAVAATGAALMGRTRASRSRMDS